MKPHYETQKLPYRIFIANHLIFPSHLHNSFELLYVLEGTLTMRLDQQVLRVHDGDSLLISPNQIHEFLPDTPSKFLILIGRPSLLGDLGQQLISFLPVKPLRTKAEAIADFDPLLLSFYSRHESLTETTIKAYLYLLVSLFLENTPLIPRTTSPEQAGAQRLLSYLASHYREPLSVEITGKALGMSPSMVSKTFASLGLSFRQILNQYRIDKAKNLLNTTDLSILEIALECGYDSVRTFNRVFKDLEGVTPSAFR